MDPIAHTSHLHRQFGNTSTTNNSPAASLFNHARTSCDVRWFTSASWFPVERNEPVHRVAVYYRAPGNQRAIRPLPRGLQFLAHRQEYSCNEALFRDSPVYGCIREFSTRMTFPDCWKNSLQETTTVSATTVRSVPRPTPIAYRGFLSLSCTATGTGGWPTPCGCRRAWIRRDHGPRCTATTSRPTKRCSTENCSTSACEARPTA